MRRELAIAFLPIRGDHAVKTFPDDDSVVPPEILEPIGRELRITTVCWILRCG
jgi:hypothetical protein